MMLRSDWVSQHCTCSARAVFNSTLIVLDRRLLRQPIQLSPVRRYAYGQFEDGGVGVWAEGKAGWFLVEPAVEYKSIFLGMVEAIDLLYFLADNSKKGGMRRGGYRGSKGADEQCRSLFKKASRVLGSLWLGC